MTDARQDVLTAFLSFATEYGDGPFARAVAEADPRLEDVANGTVVVLSPPDVPTRKLLLEPAHRRNLDDAVELAKAAGWRVDPPRPGAPAGTAPPPTKVPEADVPDADAADADVPDADAAPGDAPQAG